MISAHTTSTWLLPLLGLLREDLCFIFFWTVIALLGTHNRMVKGSVRGWEEESIKIETAMKVIMELVFEVDSWAVNEGMDHRKDRKFSFQLKKQA